MTAAGPAFLLSGGEMGERIGSLKWSSSLLGPLHVWPQHLKTAVSLCLLSRFPTFILYGSSMLGIYNDAFIPVLGPSKHPRFLGARCEDCWPEIWTVVKPRLQRVMDERSALWNEDSFLPIERNGILEETYFTYSYTPLCGPDGTVEGVFVTLQETTSRVLGERRLHSLHSLASNASDAFTVGEATRLTLKTLAENPNDFPFAVLYLRNRSNDGIELHGSVGLIDSAILPAKIETQAREGRACATNGRSPSDSMSEWTQDWLDVLKRGPSSVVLLGPHLQVLLWPDNAQRPKAAATISLGTRAVQGLLILGSNPMHPVDDGLLNFNERVAVQVAATLNAAHTFALEKERSEALSALDRAKTKFFHNASHELRTPLTLLLSPLEELLQRGDTPYGEELRLMHRNCVRLLKLVNEMLDFSRIEAGRMQGAFQATDLALLTADVASLFRAACERAGIRLIVECPSLPQAVYVDLDMWEKIVLNLLSNAFNHTERGEIHVQVREQAGLAALIVRDTGCGIAPEEMPHLFERFHRNHRTRRVRMTEGAGIGLALVAELVRLHGGTIRAESKENMGTTFYVTLPFGRLHLPPDAVTSAPLGGSVRVCNLDQQMGAYITTTASAAATVVGSSSTQLASSAQVRNRVFLVEDHDDLRQYLSRVLSECYQVQTAGDGEEALQTLREVPLLPDLVLTDIMMPRMDGLELLQAIRSDERLKGLPVIFLSARAGEAARSEGLTSGADDYLVKPFSAKELLARVGVRIEMSRMRQETEKRERALREEAERANRTKDKFIAIVSHELRTPLAPVLLLAEEAQADPELPQRLQEDMATIIRNVQLEIQLIGDLLDIAKVTQQKLSLQLRLVDAHELLRQTVAILRCGAEEKRIHIELQLNAELHYVSCDPTRLQQIYWNVLSNALKFTPSGGRVTLRSVNTRAADWVLFCLEFIDTGIGIEAKHLANLFNAFEQGGDDINRRFGGLGLGLCISSALANLHGGKLEAASEGLGRGATFTLSLSAVASPALPPADGPQLHRQALPSAVTSDGSLRILLVEDNATMACVLRRMLECRLHHDVVLAPTFSDALSQLATNEPLDLVLCDMGLPDGNGLDLMPHILARQPRARAIALTGFDTDSDKQRSLEAGFVAHLTKPIRFSELAEAIHKAGSPAAQQA